MSEGQIRVECDCGKAARVPARFAGRQVKCGGCGSALTIPDPDDEDEDDYEDDYEDEQEDLRAKAPQRRTRTGRTRTGRSKTGAGRGRSTGRKRAGSRVGSRVGSRAGSRVSKKRASGTGRVGAGRRRRSSEEDDDPYAPSRAVLRDGGKGRGRSRGRGRNRGGTRFLTTEGHICAIGIWNVISGGFLVLFGLLFMVSGGAMAQALGGGAGGTLGGVFAFLGIIFLLMGGAYVASGIGLMKRQGWARIVYTIIAALALLGQVGGLLTNPAQAVVNLPSLAYTIASLATLYGQNGSRIFSRGYLDSIRGDRRSLPWAPSPFFWTPFILGGLYVVVVFANAGSR